MRTVRQPPRKQPGQGKGPRRIDGVALDVRGGASLLGGTEKQMRGMVARRIVPFRRLGTRIIFIRTELEQFLLSLDGCSLDEARKNREARHG